MREQHTKKSGGQSLPESFRNAFHGIVLCVKSERNMKIHCFAAGMVILFGFLLHISLTEWCICLTLFGLVMALELVSTSVEAAVDLVTDEWKELAGKAKDMAAGAVLAAAIMAAAAGLIIFLPKLWALAVKFF